MSDSAKGSLAGFLFQFERALLLLTKLDNNSNFISIEDVDDIATHRENGTVLIADQAKHSISQSGSTFEDTSYSLWRTIELWILKLENKTLNEQTKFICSTNKQVKKTSLLYSICNEDFDSVLSKIQNLEKNQKQKLTELRKKEPQKGKSIEKNIKLMNFVLKKEEHLKIVHKSISIEDIPNIKELIYNKLLLNTDKYSSLQRENIYHSMIGWLVDGSLYKWKDSRKAKFSKSQMDNKYHSTLSTPSISNAIFRAKESFNIDKNTIRIKKDGLFVKQIQAITRRKDAQERIVKRAIEDFIKYEIEHTYVINEIGEFTKEDFKKFIDSCYESWQSYFDTKVIYELSEYNEKEKNEIAINIYDYVMTELKINFNYDYPINTSNDYIKNGSFLKLSNIPKIGWLPDWESKFKK
ncbi:ABC-three component system protein [Winogradskyella helgolandensis]|uniref:ABC-three component system protein n=1 Tax=Winogradskyella helgolandensis TaxID=2697010 RepID=UPI0015CD0FEE|nr:ABC-three component system protein [Winogradskyella helgolandensis]